MFVDAEKHLAGGHTFFQPLPGQTLHVLDRHTRARLALMHAASPTYAPFMRTLSERCAHGLSFARVERLQLGGDRGGVCVLRDVDGAQGVNLAAALQGSYGLDVLLGRGTQNQCSQALGCTPRSRPDLAQISHRSRLDHA